MPDLYEPCMECHKQYGRQHTDWCEENCIYAILVQHHNKCVHALEEKRNALKGLSRQLDAVIGKITKED